MKKKSYLLILLMVVVTGATPLRSPKDAANQPKKLKKITAIVANDTSLLMPPEQLAFTRTLPPPGTNRVTIDWTVNFLPPTNWQNYFWSLQSSTNLVTWKLVYTNVPWVMDLMWITTGPPHMFYRMIGRSNAW